MSVNNSEQSVVMTKDDELPTEMSDIEFAANVTAVKALQDDAYAAVIYAGNVVLTYALRYYELDMKLDKNANRRRILNETLGLSEQQATRRRTIGKAFADGLLDEVQRYLSAELESIYEVVRAMRTDAPAVFKAIKERRLTPTSTLRDIRNIRKDVDPLLKEQEKKWSPNDTRKLVFEVHIKDIPRWEDITTLCEHLASVCPSNATVELRDKDDLKHHVDGYWDVWTAKEQTDLKAVRKAVHDAVRAGVCHIPQELQEGFDLLRRWDALFRDDSIHSLIEQWMRLPQAQNVDVKEPA